MVSIFIFIYSKIYRTQSNNVCMFTTIMHRRLNLFRTTNKSYQFTTACYLLELHFPFEWPHFNTCVGQCIIQKNTKTLVTTIPVYFHELIYFHYYLCI